MFTQEANSVTLTYRTEAIKRNFVVLHTVFLPILSQLQINSTDALGQAGVWQYCLPSHTIITLQINSTERERERERETETETERVKCMNKLYFARVVE